jgi:hypothetical protein
MGSGRAWIARASGPPWASGQMMSPNRAYRWFTEIMKIFGLTNNKKPKGSEKIPKNPKIFGLPKNRKTERIRKNTEKPKPMKTEKKLVRPKPIRNFLESD